MACAVVVGALVYSTKMPVSSSPASTPPPAATISRLPLSFEPRADQTAAGAEFLARAPGYNLWLTPAEAVVGFKEGGTPLRLRWLGADPAAAGAADRRLPGARHYFLGADPGRWRHAVSAYGRVEYRAVYPGIDLVYYGRDGRLEFDWRVAPDADPQVIRLKVAGARRVSLAENGGLHLETGDGNLLLDKPVIYQDGLTGRREIAGGYRVQSDNEVGFWLGDYDHSRPLIIDPVLVYGSYLGGDGAEQSSGVAVDANGNVYLTGQTASANFPVSAALQGANGGGTDAFVAKFNAAGELVYVTYLGGAGTDRAFAVAADASGAAYVVGDTDSNNFPTQNPKQAANAGGSDAFAVKLSADGAALVYATYLGGAALDSARAVTLGAGGAAYVAGGTTSADFPVTAGVVQPVIAGLANDGVYKADGFITELSADGASAVFSTYWGGTDLDSISAIALTSIGEVVVAGGTTSAVVFPISTSNLQSTFQGFPEDGFISRLSASGDAMRYSSYFGGNSWDRAYTLALDGDDNMYIAGVTVSNNLPVTAGAFQTAFGGGRGDAFAAKLNAAGTSLIYSTYLGGSDLDQAYGIVRAADGGLVVAGESLSADFPLNQPLQFSRFGSKDAFVSRLNATATQLDWSTYLGGSGDDSAAGVAISNLGKLSVAGSTSSTDFPAMDAVQTRAAGSGDGFLAVLEDIARSADVAVNIDDRLDPASSGSSVIYDITVSNNGPDAASGLTLRSEIPAAFNFVSATPGQGACRFDNGAVVCEIGEIAAGGNTQLALELRANTGGTQNVAAGIVRTRQPDPNPNNNSDTEETILTVGSGGGASPALVVLLAAAAVWRRRRDRLQLE